MISVTELRSGTVFEDNGNYFLVLSYEHIKMGRGTGTIKVRARNLESGATIDKSFTTGAKVQNINLERKKAQYLWRAGSNFHFMDTQTYDQFALTEKIVGEAAKFLKEGSEITLAAVGERPLYIEIPKIIDYQVSGTGGSARGNTVGAVYKDATLENGLTVKVPLFIKTGEVIRVDTRTGTYVERAK